MKSIDKVKMLIARLKRWGEKLLSPLVLLSKKLVLPGFKGIPLYDVSIFFYKGLTKTSINLRASAISFDFVMALAPAVLFLFTLIPYLPIPNLYPTVMETLHDSLPENAYLTIRSTIEDIISRSHKDLLSIGFLLSILFASNGMITVIRAFNHSVIVAETRSAVKLRLISIFLVIVTVFILIIASGLQVFSYYLIGLVSNHSHLPPFWYTLMFFTAKYLVFSALLLSVFSFIYYLAPARRGTFRFISPGSTLAAIVSLITLEVFSFVINNFGHYNKIYGSLGTLIVVLLLINIYSLILLIGFELNASINFAKKDSEKKE